MASYTSTFMRSIWTASRQNCDSFQLSNAICSWIIAVGIRKRHMIRPYRRSKGGTNLFHCIHIITITKSHPTSEELPEPNWVHHENLVTPTINNNRGILAMFSHVNASSIYHKVLTIQQHVSMIKSTLCAVTETWFPNEKKDQKYKEVPPWGYKILSHSCNGRRRGGSIAIVYKNNLKIKEEMLSQTSKIMEYMNVSAHLSGINFDAFVICHYPGSSVRSFCKELTNILEINITQNRGHLLLLGDVNIHLDNQDVPDIITFQDFMDSIRLINRTKQPTHIRCRFLILLNKSWSKLVFSGTVHWFCSKTSFQLLL